MPRLTEAQRDRSTYLGASDIAVIAGVSKWQSPYELYLEKIGELDRDAAAGPEAAKRFERGHRLEDVALDWYADEAGVQVERVHRDVIHPRMPFVIVHPDGRVKPWRTSRKLVEAKTARSRWDQLPEYVEAQVQMQMAASGATSADVACLTWDGLDRFEVTRNDELIAALEVLAARFWKRVQDRNPPPLDGSYGASKYLDGLFRAEPEQMATPLQREILMELATTREQLARYAERELLLINQLKETMAGGSRLVAPGLATVNWTAPTPRRNVAWKDVAAAYRRTLDELAHRIQVDPMTGRLLRGGGWDEPIGRDVLPYLPGIPEQYGPGPDGLEALHTTTAEGVRTFRVTPAKEPARDR